MKDNKNQNIQNPKGTHDILPQEVYKWQYIEDIAKQVAACYNCVEIRTPIFEYTELFLRGVGDSTDIVSKEMYTFVDKGDRSLTLKPEGTASIARSFVQNNLDSAGLPLRLFYVTPVFRYENPQKGRYRQHHQFGVEFFGDSSAYMDYEVMHLAYTFLTKLGLKNISLNINSIGCVQCRPEYLQALKQFVTTNLDNFCPTCKTRLDTNPLRILDCKVKSCIATLRDAPIISNHLCSHCSSHQATLVAHLNSSNIAYTINPHIVRGLDYYNRTVFEVVTHSDALANQSTICGGGRYDSLIESLGGKPTQCVGFGLGLERLIVLMDEEGLSYGQPDKPTISIMYANLAQIDYAMQLASTLRMQGIRVDIDYTGKSLKSQFRRADKCGSKFSLVIGQTEVETGKIVLKNLYNGQQNQVELDQLYTFLMQATV